MCTKLQGVLLPWNIFSPCSIVQISKLTSAKILDNRSSPSGAEYKCELKPLWLPADVVRKAQMGRVHTRIYEQGPTRAGHLGTLRVRKAKSSINVITSNKATFSLCSTPIKVLIYLHDRRIGGKGPIRYGLVHNSLGYECLFQQPLIAQVPVTGQLLGWGFADQSIIHQLVPAMFT